MLSTLPATITPPNICIGENIEHLRLEKKKSIKEMASLLQLTHTGYRNLERGKTEITATKIYLVAKIFNVPLSQILDFENSENNPGTKILRNALKKDTEGDKQLIKHYKEEVSFLRKQLELLTTHK